MLVWTHRNVAADPAEAWALFCDLDRWSEWGPSVAGATLDDPGAFTAGATGRVRTALGPSLPFRVTEHEVPDDPAAPGATWRWAWRVAGIPATSHTVEAVDGGARIGFGVPVVVAPYLAVCAIALRRMESSLT